MKRTTHGHLARISNQGFQIVRAAASCAARELFGGVNRGRQVAHTRRRVVAEPLETRQLLTAMILDVTTPMFGATTAAGNDDFAAIDEANGYTPVNGHSVNIYQSGSVVGHTVAPGDTVAGLYFPAGEYGVSQTLLLKNNYTYLGTNKTATIVAPQHSSRSAFKTNTSSNITIDGLTFNGRAIFGLDGTNDDLTIQNNRFTGTYVGTTNTNTIFLGTDGTVSNTTIQNNEFVDLFGNHDTGIFMYYPEEVTITGNTFRNANEGMHLLFADPVAGIGNNVEISYNDFVGIRRMAVEAQGGASHNFLVTHNRMSSFTNYANVNGSNFALSIVTYNDDDTQPTVISHNEISDLASWRDGTAAGLLLGVEVCGDGTILEYNKIYGTNMPISAENPSSEIIVRYNEIYGFNQGTNGVGHNGATVIDDTLQTDTHATFPQSFDAVVAFDSIVTGDDTAESFHLTGSDITRGLSSFSLPPTGPSSYPGRVILYGYGGNDTIVADSGTDLHDMVVEAGDGADSVTTGAGNDSLRGEAGTDTLVGNNGNDTLAGGAGSDSLAGGSGTNSLETASETAAVTINLATPSSSVDASISGFTHVYTGDGNDTITGDSGNNYIFSGMGSDSLNGGAGNDTLNGWGGGDVINGGGSGIDTADYSDRFVSGGGWDFSVNVSLDGVANDGDNNGGTEGDNVNANISVIRGTVNPDVISASGVGTSVSLYGNDGNDTLTGGSGNDWIEGGAGSDSLAGGSGTGDTLSYADFQDALTISLATPSSSHDASITGFENVVGGEGNDALTGDGNANSLSGGRGDDTLTGNSGSDTLRGGDDTDSLNGGAGTDTLDGGFGPDTFTGGSENDVVDYTSRTAPVSVTIDANDNDGEADEGDLISASDIETVWGGLADDDLDAAFVTHGMQLKGSDGNDTITGVNAVSSAVSLYGGDGNDSILGGAGKDILSGQDGDDTLRGNGDNDTLDGGLGTDVMYGDGGSADVATYTSRTTNITVSLDNVKSGAEEDNVMNSVERLQGGTGNDNFTSTNIAVTLWGNDGNDTLTGGASDDSLDGGDGNDSLDGGGGGDDFAGGAGNDTAAYDTRTSALNVTMDGTANDGQTSEGDNVGQDMETVQGGTGNDTFNASTMPTLVRFFGNDGNDTLTGGAGRDSLDGGAGADSLSGGNENDFLYPGLGQDTINGNSGSADFVDYSDRSVALSISLDGVANDGQSGESDNVKTDVERARGGTAGDTFTAGTSASTFWGDEGNDTFFGGSAADIINGENGNDVFNTIGGGVDTLDGGGGTDNGTNTDASDVKTNIP